MGPQAQDAASGPAEVLGQGNIADISAGGRRRDRSRLLRGLRLPRSMQSICLLGRSLHCEDQGAGSRFAPSEPRRRDSIEREVLLPRDLDKPAVATGGTALGIDRSRKIRVEVGPHDRLAAVAIVSSRHVDLSGGVDGNVGGRRHRRVFRLSLGYGRGSGIRVPAARDIAADQHRAATRRAGGVDGGAGKRNILAGDLNLAAGLAAYSCRQPRACRRPSPSEWVRRRAWCRPLQR